MQLEMRICFTCWKKEVQNTTNATCSSSPTWNIKVFTSYTLGYVLLIAVGSVASHCCNSILRLLGWLSVVTCSHPFSRLVSSCCSPVLWDRRPSNGPPRTSPGWSLWIHHIPRQWHQGSARVWTTSATAATAASDASTGPSHSQGMWMLAVLQTNLKHCYIWWCATAVVAPICYDGITIIRSCF